MDDSLAIVACLLLVAVLVFMFVIYALAFRELKRRYEHGMKVATGNFKVKVGAKEWVESTAKGCFALAVKDKNSGKVVFSVMVEKEEHD